MLQIQPRPAQAKGDWLPAEQISLHDSWQDPMPAFKVGEPVARTITIQAKGLVSSQIPPLQLAQPASARLYREAPDNQSQTDGKTTHGSSKQIVTAIPDTPGTLDITPVTLAWWNTRPLPGADFRFARAPPIAFGRDWKRSTTCRQANRQLAALLSRP